MKHGRPDYNNRIIDLAAFLNEDHTVTEERIATMMADLERNPPPTPIGKDEPVFLLRATDQIAPMIVREYARIIRQRSAAPNHWLQHEQILDVARAMEEWQMAHGAKLPDVPEPAGIRT